MNQNGNASDFICSNSRISLKLSQLDPILISQPEIRGILSYGRILYYSAGIGVRLIHLGKCIYSKLIAHRSFRIVAYSSLIKVHLDVFGCFRSYQATLTCLQTPFIQWCSRRGAREASASLERIDLREKLHFAHSTVVSHAT